MITVSAFDLPRLLRTLESCKNLDSDLEHLFVIPSADLDSIQAIKSYSEEVNFQVRVVNDKKEGIYAAMNIGAHNALGVYALFLNAGDEVSSVADINANVVNLKKYKPTWAITGVSLPWDPCYKAFKGMDINFRLQKKNGYVSHQSIFVRLDEFINLGGLDTNFPIAADTKQIFQLSAKYPPLILLGIAIKVEEGFNVTSHNRESRIEVLRLINSDGINMKRVISNFNFFYREATFIFRRLSRLFYWRSSCEIQE